MRPAQSQTSASSREEYGPGWTQLTEHGKIYLSKKEKNVFILEGTKAAGFSVCAYAGSPEERTLIEAETFALTVELKSMPGDQCPDQHVFVLLDCVCMTDLSSGCDFCGVHMSFDSRDLKVELHRRNSTAQVIFAQPGCALLRSQTYVTLLVEYQSDSISITLNGVSIVSNLPTTRPKASDQGKGGSGTIGVAVYGRTRCYLRRFRVSAVSAQSPGRNEEQHSKVQWNSQGGSRSVSSTSRKTTTGIGQVPYSGAVTNAVVEDMELAVLVDRDIVSTDLKVHFDDIGGLDDAKRAINEAVLLPLLMPEFFVGLRQPWKGVLLFGPPGTGKTMLAKAVASCAENVTFFNCSSATLTSKWRGESEKLLRALFTAARARVPSILFFDEIDSLLSQRGSTGEHEASRRFKSEFLIHMDGLLSSSQAETGQAGHLLVLATSNAPWDLDEALRRRLEKRIYIPLPDEVARLRMIENHLKEIKIADDVDFSSLAQRTDKYSGADIQLICREASMNPMRRLIEGLSPMELVQLRNDGKLEPSNLVASMVDFEDALASIQPSVSFSDTQKYVEWSQEFGSK